ncbi:hypothetical protein P7C73_g3179, partial [Tremellales sp. Uapishka_1]
MFDKLRNDITKHFHSSPLARQRAEFLAVDQTTPIEKKAHFTAEVVGAAAAYEAFKAFERHEINKGQKPSHGRAKEVIVGVAGGYVVKLIDEKGLPFTSDANKKEFQARAQKNAIMDSKRALRESGLYQGPELEPLDLDEKSGQKIM